MRRLLRPTLIVTMFTLGGQVLVLLTQMVVASAFGARAELDAFLAANTLPQYVAIVVVGALSPVIVPVFVEHRARQSEDEAFRVANVMLTLVAVVLGGVAVAGALFARPLIEWTTPGLSRESLETATRVAWVSWPTIVFGSLTTLLMGIYQAQSRFSWSSAVPFIGSLVNLVVVAVLAQPLGVMGLALGALMNIALQFVLLAPIAFRRFQPSLAFARPGVPQVLRLVWPLLLSGLVVRWAPVVERYFASGLGEGTIAQLGYAYRISIVASALLATGITTVVFPQMAVNIAASNGADLRRTVSLGLRVMWMLVAPAVTVGIALAPPLIDEMLHRGQFSQSDASAVVLLLRIYLVSMVGGCIGSITGRTFYAMKAMRLLAIMGVIEAVAYLAYTYALVQWLGAAGIALGLTAWLLLSIGWQLPVLWVQLGRRGGGAIFRSGLLTAAAATLAGGVAWGVTHLFETSGPQLVVGGASGLAAYLLVLYAARSEELHSLIASLRRQS